MDSVKGGDAILARVREHLGAVRQADLCLSRQERRVVQRLVDSGRLRRHPSGLIAEPRVDERVLVARLHRGLVTCLHAAAHYRLPVPYPPGPVHVLTPKGSTAPRLRHEHLHETRGHSAAPPQSFPVVSEARCVADVLCCAEEWTAMVIVDAALRRGRVSADQIASHLRGSRRHLGRVRLSRASARARSPLETLARIQLRAEGMTVDDGVVIAGVGEVDLLVGGGLVVELDGYDYHSDRWTFEKDRRRDRELVRQGYRVLRFTSNEVRSGRIVGEVAAVLAAHPGAGR